MTADFCLKEKITRRLGRVLFKAMAPTPHDIYLVHECMDLYTLAYTHTVEDLKLGSGYGAVYNKNEGNRIIFIH